MCPDDNDKKKKKGKKDHSPNQHRHRGKLIHAGDNIGQFTTEQMNACLDEITYYKD